MFLEDIDLLLGRDVQVPGFQYSVNCVVSLYRRVLGRVTTDGVGKVAVCLLPPSLKCGVIPLQILDTIVVEEQFDFASYWSRTIHERKRSTLDILHQGLLKVARHYNWEHEPFEEAYAKALSRDLDTSFFWDRAVTRNDLTAMVFCDFGTQRIEVSIVFMQQQGEEQEEVARQFLLALKPAELFLHIVLGDLQWISDNTLLLSTRIDNLGWEISVHENQITVKRLSSVMPGEILSTT